MATPLDEKEARRKKIRELESSLFNNEWTSERTTDLPTLKNVDEYASAYGLAQTQKQPSRPKSLKPIKRPSSLFKMRRPKSKETFDEIPLIEDDDDEEEEDGEQDGSVSESSKKLSKSQKLLKSEVEQLDQAFSKIFNDEPALNVIENLKKKHGLIVEKGMYVILQTLAV